MSLKKEDASRMLEQRVKVLDESTYRTSKKSPSLGLCLNNGALTKLLYRVGTV